VAECIKALEDAGILSWVNRLVRVRERCEDLFGHWGSRTRVIRTSNGYQFNDPKPPARPVSLGNSSKSDFPSGTPFQDSISTVRPSTAPDLDPDNPLQLALLSLGRAVGAIP
jgi:hypothetical protein